MGVFVFVGFRGAWQISFLVHDWVIYKLKPGHGKGICGHQVKALLAFYWAPMDLRYEVWTLHEISEKVRCSFQPKG